MTMTNNPKRLDYSHAKPQRSFGLIPKGTIVKVRLTIKPGGYDDPAKGWEDGYATYNAVSGTIYLDCEFTILEGPYAKRKVWGLIGLHSPKESRWGQWGASFIRAILCSARGFSQEDISPQAVEGTCLERGFADLDGIKFFARISGEVNKRTGQERNVIKMAVTKGHRDYPPSLGVSPATASSWAR